MDKYTAMYYSLGLDKLTIKKIQISCVQQQSVSVSY